MLVSVYHFQEWAIMRRRRTTLTVITAIPPMDIILAAFTSAALLARTITVITITGDDDPKTEDRPALRRAAFIRGSLLPPRKEVVRKSTGQTNSSSPRKRGP